MDVTDQATAAAVAFGLTEVAKQTGMPSRFAPIVSVLTGVAITVLLVDAYGGSAIVAGMIAGLSAAGLWSGAKATIKG